MSETESEVDVGEWVENHLKDRDEESRAWAMSFLRQFLPSPTEPYIPPPEIPHW